jgi:signal transduction histidine kinase/CHASE1-domain containing sensor protein
MIFRTLPGTSIVMRNIALAAAYFLAGWISHQLNQFPNYAAPVWFPAGIALAAVLLGSKRLLPGIWLGTFAITAYQLVGRSSSNLTVICSAIVACGAVLQALLGARLAPRNRDGNMELADGNEVLRFLALSCLLACLVSATFGAVVLWATGQIAIAEIGATWFTWWVGDSIGAIAVTPILYTLMAEKSPLWFQRRATVTPPLTMMLIAIFIIFAIVSWLDRQRNEAEFERHASLLSSALITAFNSAEEASNTLTSFLRSTNTLDAQEFERFATSLHHLHPAIQALEWIPVVSENGLTAHEKDMRTHGWPRYSVFEKDKAGVRHPVASRAEYFPVQYVVPLKGNEAALGYDLGSESIRYKGIEDARRSGHTALTSRVRLVQETGQQNGVLAFEPLYQPVGDEARKFLGLTLSVIRVGQLCEAALQNLPTESIAYQLNDLDSPSAEQLLYASGQIDKHTSLGLTINHEIGGRHWQFTFGPSLSYQQIHQDWFVWLTYTGSLVVALLLSAFLLLTTGHALRVEQLVAERTRELDHAKVMAERASNLLNEAVSSIAQGFTIYDEEDRLVICNEAYKTFYEESRDLIVPGNTFEMIVRTGAERGQYRDAIGNIDEWVRQRVLAHQNANGEAIEQRLGNGRWLLIVEYRTPSGYIVGNRVDITELKRATAALEDRNAQLDAIFSLSPDGFAAFGTDGRIKFVNPAFVTMTDIKLGDAVGLMDAELDSILRQRAEQPEKFPALGTCFGEENSLSAIHSLTLKRPKLAVLQIVGVRSKAPTVPRILYFRNVTAEAEVDRMKSEFLSHAAHELRTPMASIYGFSELLLNMELDAPTQRDVVETIHRQTRLLVDIINELLDLARIEARRGKDFTYLSMDLVALVREVVSDLAIDPQRWPVKLDLPTEPLIIVADAAKSRQAVLNVLSNARKYSPQGGPIRVTTIREPERVGLIVEDHGIGMTAAQLARVGERFWRADTSGSTPGTGLGVAIVKEILELHGGSIDVASQANQGTTVTLWWPASAAMKRSLPSQLGHSQQ